MISSDEGSTSSGSGQDVSDVMSWKLIMHQSHWLVLYSQCITNVRTVFSINKSVLHPLGVCFFYDYLQSSTPPSFDITRALIGWNSVHYQSTSTDARSNPWRHSVPAGKLKTFLARACKLWIKLAFLQIKANFFTNVSKAILWNK